MRINDDKFSNLTWEIYLLNVSEYCVGIMQIASGAVLIYAMVRIRQIIRKGLNSPQLDKQALLVHALAFGLYMFSVLILYIT